MSNERRIVLMNPCSPCVCRDARCEHCVFGYRPAAENHESMKKLLLKYMATEEPFPGRGQAELYMRYHPDWRDAISDIPEAKTEEKETPANRFAQLAKDVRELYSAFRNEGFTEEESIELTKTYLGIAFQEQMIRDARERKSLTKSELAARLNRYKEEHKDKEESK